MLGSILGAWVLVILSVGLNGLNREENGRKINILDVKVGEYRFLPFLLHFLLIFELLNIDHNILR